MTSHTGGTKRIPKKPGICIPISRLCEVFYLAAYAGLSIGLEAALTKATATVEMLNYGNEQNARPPKSVS
jgi:hypothetical protein